MKFTIRLIMKILATPIVMVIILSILSVLYGIRFFEWLYDAHETSKNDTTIAIKDFRSDLKKWFTTI